MSTICPVCPRKRTFQCLRVMSDINSRQIRLLQNSGDEKQIAPTWPNCLTPYFHTHIALALRRSCSQTRPRACSRRVEQPLTTPGLRPQAPPGLAYTKSLRSYPLAERDSLLRQRRRLSKAPCLAHRTTWPNCLTPLFHTHIALALRRSCSQTRPRACSRRAGS